MTITNAPVFTWMLTGTDASLDFVECRYLLAGHVVGVYEYRPGKTPDEEWRGVQTYAYASTEEALEKAIRFTEMDEIDGYTLFGPTVVAKMGIDHGYWASLVAEDEFGSGMGPVLDYVQGVLQNVQAFGTELG